MLTTKERIAYWILNLVKYDNEEFVDCAFNDLLFDIVDHMGLDHVKVFEKVANEYLNNSDK